MDLAPEPDYKFDNFYEGRSNIDALKALKAYPAWPIPVMLLIGPAASGKTHLGQAWLKANKDSIFIDDADKMAEGELFSQINKALNGEISGVLLTSRQPVNSWSVMLPDLRSRLANIPVVTMSEPDEDILEPITRKLFEDLGREVRSDLVTYICCHYERSVPAVARLVADIDLAARENKRDVTRSFVAEYIKKLN